MNTFCRYTTIKVFVIMLIAVNLNAQNGPSPSIDQNHIVEHTPREGGIMDKSQLATKTVDEVNRTIQYVDGLGRPMQSVVFEGSPDGFDVVQPIAYDEFGREKKKYLPYVANATDGAYKASPINSGDAQVDYHSSPQYQFYENHFNSPQTPMDPYAETVFEPSSLNRVLKQGAPGTAWQPDSIISADDHSVKFVYTTNDSAEVYLWEIKDDNCVLAEGDYYEENQLYVSVTKDENWLSTQTFTEAGTVREYTDKQGRVVLKRIYAVNDENTGVDEYNTYYVYDDFGNLRVVIPPEAIAELGSSLDGIDESNVFSEDITLTGSHSQGYYYYPGVTVTLGTTFNGTNGFFLKPYPVGDELINNYLFTYKYDSRQRMVEKKVPGAEPVYMVYDKRDRLVLTQDGEQRKDDEWLFTKYDALNRPVLTGEYTNTLEIGQGNMQTFVDGEVGTNSTWYETTNDDPGNVHGYDNASFPQIADASKYLTVTYYDNYAFNTNTDMNYEQSSDEPYDELVKLDNPKGQVTGGKIRNLETMTHWYTNIVYYDRKYRPIYSVSDNHKDGLDKSYNAYNFVGDVTNSRYVHTATNQDSLTIDKEFNYDHVSRLLSIDYKVDNGDTVTLLANEYNEIGELITKRLHDEGSGFAQEVDYAYNIRGWLTEINDPTNVSLAGDYFGMELKYNETPTSVLNSEAQYNGNISEIHWANAQTDRLSGYGFQYDDINRLKKSRYGEGSSFTASNGHWDENMNYDLNGNIGSLFRKAAGLTVDSLEYDYTGNRLNYVNDRITAYAGDENHFKDGTPGPGLDYVYDDNGNMISDANKGIQNISYNHLNLPDLIDFGGGNTIAYIYDATGVKLSKVVTKNSTSTTTDYIGGIVYEDNVRKFISTEEGRIIPELVAGSVDYEYQYHMKDHLGNVRLTFSTKEQVSTYMATMESVPEVRALEEASFDNISNTQHQDQLYNITDSLVVPGAKMSARLNAADSKVMGPAMSLHVMAGDEVNMSVFAKYTSASNSSTPVTGMAAIVAASAGVGGVTEAAQVTAGLNDVLGAGQAAVFSSDNTIPKAYINYLFFDKNRQYKSGGFDQVSTAALNSFEELSLNFYPDEEGYMIIYVANQTNENLNVYFDDLTIEHIEGPIIQTDDYYPFGLTFNSSERSGYTTNKFRFQGQEHQEETGWDSFKWRNHQPDIGRFFNIDPLAEDYYYNSPYAFSENRVIDGVELEGLEWKSIKVDNTTTRTITLKVKNSSQKIDDSGKYTLAFGIAQQVDETFTSTSEDGHQYVTKVELDFDSEIKEGDFYLDFVDVVEGSSEAAGKVDEIGNTESNRIQVRVRPKGTARTGAHEVGHTGGLRHPDDPKNDIQIEDGNIMQQSKDSNGTDINDSQQKLVDETILGQ